jgi:hypothetical protein
MKALVCRGRGDEASPFTTTLPSPAAGGRKAVHVPRAGGARPAGHTGRDILVAGRQQIKSTTGRLRLGLRIK